MSDKSNAAIINQRIAIIKPLKDELIQRLNLAYTSDDLHEDISLFGAGLGLDSLDALEIVLAVEHCFNIKIPEENISILRSLNTIVDYIIEEQQKGGPA